MKLKVSFVLISILFVSCYMGYKVHYSLSHSDYGSAELIFKNDSLKIEVYIDSEDFWCKDRKKSLEEVEELFKVQNIDSLRFGCYIEKKESVKYEINELNFTLIQKKQNLFKEYPLIERDTPIVLKSYNNQGMIKYSNTTFIGGKFNINFTGMDKSSYSLRYNADLLINKVPKRFEGEIDLLLLIKHRTMGGVH